MAVTSEPLKIVVWRGEITNEEFSIVDVRFDSYENPQFLRIALRNPEGNAYNYELRIYVDTYDTSEDPIRTIEGSINPYDVKFEETPVDFLGKGEHFVYVELVKVT